MKCLSACLVQPPSSAYRDCEQTLRKDSTTFVLQVRHLVKTRQVVDGREPKMTPPPPFHLNRETQPGSTVATSLCEGEAVPKHVFVLDIRVGDRCGVPPLFITGLVTLQKSPSLLNLLPLSWSIGVTHFHIIRVFARLQTPSCPPLILSFAGEQVPHDTPPPAKRAPVPHPGGVSE
jgi:hypothetical protein